MTILMRVVSFLGPLLFFLLELMSSNRILPHYGGSSMVWIASTFFFTIVLLLGYALVDFGHRYFAHRPFSLIHALLLITALFFLPLEILRFMDTASPAQDIFLTLSSSLGFPFLVLSMTTPWIYELFTKMDHNEEHAYQILFYSNLGSFFGLFLGPLILFNIFSMTTLFQVCTGLFVLYILLSIYLLFAFFNLPDAKLEKKKTPNFKQAMGWFYPSFVMVLLLLAVTNMTTLGIGASPLLWFLPLAIYLFSFIINFSRVSLYSPKVQTRLIFLWLFFQIASNLFTSQYWQKLSYLNFYFFLYLACVTLARDLYLKKPGKDMSSTSYNLCLNIGGLTASMIVLFLIPKLNFNIGNMNIELFFGTLCFGIFLILRDRKRFWDWWKKETKTWKKVSFATVVLALFISMTTYLVVTTENDVYFKRNFYGMNRVIDQGDVLVYLNGRTIHGGQYKADELQRYPLYYYQPSAPVGEVLKDLPEGKKVFAIGLGVGSLTAYAKPHDEWTFVDIDPDVIDIAQRFFNFIRNSKGEVKILTGDGRKKLEQTDGNFDLIIIDAFSNDSIPTHLLTREAFQLYQQKLNSSGQILIHDSGNSLDLEAILQPEFKKLGMYWASKKSIHRTKLGLSASSWFLAGYREDSFDHLKQNLAWEHRHEYENGDGWNDDQVNLLLPLWAGLKKPD